MKPLLEIQSIRLSYDDGITNVLNNSSAILEKGKLTALIGKNGAGKSSLLNAILGQMSLNAGNILFKGKNILEYSITDKSKLISTVRTKLTDLGYMTVKEFVSLGRYPYTSWSGKLVVQDLEIIDQVMEDMGISTFTSRYLFELSDGERQKTIIARALVQDTDLILMDEPIAFVDPVGSLEILTLLKKQCHDKGKTILYSSHDLGSTFVCADNLWLIDKNGELKSGTATELLENGEVESAFGQSGYHLSRDQVGFRPV